MDENNEIRIDLSSIFKVLKKNLIIILAVVLVFGAAGYFMTDIFVTPRYQVTASGILDVGVAEGSEDIVNPGSIVTSQTFAKDFAEILTSSSVLDIVVEDLAEQNCNVTYNQLRGMITVALKSESNSQIINISVNSTDKELALMVTETLLKVGSENIESYIAMAAFVPFDGPRYANNGGPISPSLSNNTILAALVGGVIICGILIGSAILNDTIRNEKDFEKIGFNVIGRIPRVDQSKRTYTKYQNTTKY